MLKDSIKKISFNSKKGYRIIIGLFLIGLLGVYKFSQVSNKTLDGGGISSLEQKDKHNYQLKEKMKVSHILYKVEDLDQGVESFRQQGFTVEYGAKKNPTNALIYFSEGPYLELIGDIKLSGFLNFVLKIIGEGKVVERLNSWHNAKEGLIAVCFENYKLDLKEEKKVLEKYNQKYFERNNSRIDTKDRLLEYKVLFPNELNIPFLMTYFNIDPKPKNYVHPNGVKKIKRISFGTKEEFIPIINELCDDETLKLFVGEGVKDLAYEKE